MAKFFALLSLVLVMTEQMEAQLHVNMDMPGSDAANMPIRMDPGADASECQALCANRQICVAFAFKPGSCENDDILCWLKYRQGPLVQNSCRVSM